MSESTEPPRTYAACRDRFRRVAAATGARTVAAPLAAQGPASDPALLTIDIAVRGPSRPERVLVVLSGVHGVEGFVGSAAQCDLLAAAPPLPPATALVLVHAVNPWGMAWLRRQNENGVDLNRNWGRSRVVFAANDAYDELHADVCPAQWSDNSSFRARMQEHVATHGLEWVSAAIRGGQDRHPDGMHYAGVRTEESNLILERTLPGLLGDAVREVVVIDLHTGEGRHGDVVILAGGPEGSPNHAWLVDVFGSDRVVATGGGLPGRIAAGLAALWPSAQHRFGTVEFGTVSDARQLVAAREEMWWYRSGDQEHPDAVAARQRYLECFTPTDPAWMEHARHHAALLLRTALGALASNPNGSQLRWLGARGRDGGIDTVPLPEGTPGGLSLCGKHAIGPDHAAAMARCGATTVVCLVEAHELDDRYPGYLAWLRANTGTAAEWFPIHDLHAPSPMAARQLLDALHRRLQRGEHLLMHCAAGIGRTGTIAACLLIELGMGAEDALAHVAAHRPMAGPEVGPQRELVEAVAAGQV